MIQDDLEDIVCQNMVQEPTDEQKAAIKEWVDFLLDKEPYAAFLLNGYAGTGKTTLVGAMVQAMKCLGLSFVLLAPTGRAAKVFSRHAGAAAHTIHKRIYRKKDILDDEHFSTSVNRKENTLFIVDESSMIANEGLTGTTFGSGRLLTDLIEYVYSCSGCRLMFMGDTAQLPPVHEEESPALNSGVLCSYGLRITEARLTQVVRQQEDSGILWNATLVRQMLVQGTLQQLPDLRCSGFPDIHTVDGYELPETLEDCYARYGTDETLVITRSNKQAHQYNMGIRGRTLVYTEELCSGDIVMVTANNYFWKGTNMGKTPGILEKMPFIANGDIARVRRIRHERELYGLRFADASLIFPDYEDCEVEATILLDVLHSESGALDKDRKTELFQKIWEDYPEITNKRERIKKIKEDPYFNALQIKYAYAVTCHKTQGGQWRCVFIDQGYVTNEMMTPGYYRWLYTALTRATEQTYLINWPKHGT